MAAGEPIRGELARIRSNEVRHVQHGSCATAAAATSDGAVPANVADDRLAQ